MTQHELVKCPHCESTSIFIHQEDDLCLCGECGEAWEQATKAHAVPQWILVSERLPENNSGLYLCSGHEGTKFVCYRRHYEWIRSPQMKRVVAITHWMPIPSLPEAVK